MKKTLFVSGILLIFYGCNPAVKNQQRTLNYFDLKGYFNKEALRLTKNNPEFTKTVTVNDSSETKKIRISDWSKELSIFSDADINRNAWKGLFKTNLTVGQDTYTSDDEKIPVKEISITRKNHEIQSIRIVMKSSNSLYSSADTLSYYPDSLYDIKKSQQIKLLSEKKYRITGSFK
jgi:hypothetical protein